MKSLEEVQELLSENLNTLKRRYKIKRLGVFGEYARGEQDDNSEVDILIEFDKGIGLEFVDLEEQLEKILGERVHIVPKSGVQRKYLKAIRQDIVYI